MKQDVIESGAIYHIFNRGNNHENLFPENKNYLYFLSLLSKYLLPVGEVYAYCLLKNHFHILIRIKDKNTLPEKLKEKPHLAFSNFFNAYTKAINKMYNRSGSLFQEHMKRKRVNDQKYLMQLIAYIHLNPVKHGFSSDFKTYRFSSYNEYFSNKGTIINSDVILNSSTLEDFIAWHDEKKILISDFE